jgi:hypothetical protein
VVRNYTGALMRLFLASSRPGPGSRELADLVVPSARVAVVANAVDNLPEFPRAEWVDEERRMLSSVGLSAFELDLRGYYHRPAALASALAEVDLVWITGATYLCCETPCGAAGLTGC